MKRNLAAAFFGLLVVSSALPAQDSIAIGSQLETWYARAKRSAPGEWGIVVANRNGQVLWSQNQMTPLIPASTVKLLTTGFARSAVGGDARRPTRVLGTGQIDPATGTWQGAWALEMNGDVTLERPGREGTSLRDLANQLATLGIKRLTGPLQVTSAAGEAVSRFPTVWEDRHRGHTFAPLIGQITLNENLVTFTVAPGARAGALATLVGSAPAGIESLVRVTAKTITGSRNNALRFSSLGNGRYQISGTIGTRARARGFTAVASDPTAVLEAAWAHATALAGIDWVQTPLPLSGPSPASRRVLAEIVSEPFDSVAHEVNTRSLNIGAELLLLWGGGGVNAAALLNQHIASVTGLATGLFHIVDGSGLSGSDRIAPIVFTTYLARFPLTPGMQNFPLLLPANGSGTLRRLASGIPEAGVVRAKTGTLGNVSTLVGYLGRNDGTLLIAAMYNGSNSGTAKSMQMDLFRKLGAHGIILPTESAEAFGGPNLEGTPRRP